MCHYHAIPVLILALPYCEVLGWAGLLVYATDAHKAMLGFGLRRARGDRSINFHNELGRDLQGLVLYLGIGLARSIVCRSVGIKRMYG